MSLAVVRDLRVARAPATPDDLAALETDVLAGFVLARAAAGLADSTIASDVVHLEQVRAWFGRALWELEPGHADVYFGKVLRETARGTRLSRAQALKTFFLFLELRHKVEIHQMTGRVVECPIDEMNRPRGRQQARLRIPPTAAQVDRLFAGWREELATCRKFAPAARNYAACRLLAEVGLRVNEACKLDLGDIKWDLGRYGKLHVRHGKGARGSGPRERMVPLINDAGATLRWFVQDVWAQFGDDHTRPGVALLPSERKNTDGTPGRVGDETLRAALAAAARTHLPDWSGVVTPHVLRHFCASELYLGGMDLIAIQATLGHAWIATTLNYVHEGSEVAADGRETAGHQVNVVHEWHLRSARDSCLSREDRTTLPPDARYARQRGWVRWLAEQQPAAAPLPLLGAQCASGAGRLAHEPCGRQKRCTPHGVLDRALGQF